VLDRVTSRGTREVAVKLNVGRVELERFMENFHTRALRRNVAVAPWWVSSYLRRESKRKGFELLRRDHFLSPNKSRNLGFAHVDTEFVAFIDNDVLFTPGWLNKLVACADEEDAAVIGPLILLGEPPLQKVHSAGGLGTIEETPLGRRYHQKQRYSETPISEVSLDAMRRGPVDTLEFHWLLARTNIVRRFPFDEALQTLLEFEDFCLEVARAGERIVFEPAAVVAQLLPPVVPRSFAETAFFLQRWHPRKNLASIVHFRQKWSLTSDDPALRDVLHWTNARRRGLLRLPALRPVRPRVAGIHRRRQADPFSTGPCPDT